MNIIPKRKSVTSILAGFTKMVADLEAAVDFNAAAVDAATEEIDKLQKHKDDLRKDNARARQAIDALNKIVGD